ncbi:ferric iron uptake transcriptional regulator [Candidatus Ichthyocystis sparus]|uniref:Ferric uptake regulation protein n=1 Tax=Candidatus Ichthyocystis hellenicum TaxID=1561003 RepID=A0A0S4M412_9BURK|nr:ferric iron uptake transcriptional regulator [Candidatus Ichthyocystis sparus]CUT18043.1 Ferric uptake regulation protein [Candidatus Ichthyocystis hellenicum]
MSKKYHLKENGLKITTPRLKILNIFETSLVKHLSADDIHKRILEEKLDISLATIYRVLSDLEEVGILVKQHFEGGKAVFELNNHEHHDHIICINCGIVEEFFDERIESLQEKVAMERGFSIKYHTLHLYVECERTNCPHKKRESSLPQNRAQTLT